MNDPKISMNLTGVSAHGSELANLLLALLRQHGHIKGTPQNLDVLMAEGYGAIERNIQATNNPVMLRQRAVELLKQAEELDGLKPFILTHNYEYGSSAYIGWGKNAPSEEQSSKLIPDFEVEKDSIAVEGNLSLRELAGTDESAHFAEIKPRKGRKGRRL